MTCTCDFVFFSDKTQDFANDIADGEFWKEESGQYMKRCRVQRVNDRTLYNVVNPHLRPWKRSITDAFTHLLGWRQSAVFQLP